MTIEELTENLNESLKTKDPIYAEIALISEGWSDYWLESTYHDCYRNPIPQDVEAVYFETIIERLAEIINEKTRELKSTLKISNNL